MTSKKRRPRQHIMEDESKAILQKILPSEWVIHEYRPDYGIDLVIELFEFVDDARIITESLGELFFVQLKAIEKSKVEKVKVYDRYNVEKRPLAHEESESKDIEVIKFKIDVSELLTIQAMGAAIPVLLILVTLNTGCAYFICLNDLIDKVILPREPEFHLKKKLTILIPIKNQLTACDTSLVPLRFYAKRSKLYSAFSKFGYQRKELNYTRDVGTLKHFIKIISRYDFWENTPEWEVIGEMYKEIRWLERLIENSKATASEFSSKSLSTPNKMSLALINILNNAVGDDGESIKEPFIWAYVPSVWDRLWNLNSMFEEICREWFLPTFLGVMMSYPIEAK